MHDLVEKMDFEISEFPSFTTVCVVKQKLKVRSSISYSASLLTFMTLKRCRLSTQLAFTAQGNPYDHYYEMAIIECPPDDLPSGSTCRLEDGNIHSLVVYPGLRG